MVMHSIPAAVSTADTHSDFSRVRFSNTVSESCTISLLERSLYHEEREEIETSQQLIMILFTAITAQHGTVLLL